jgi:beta-mannosidase
MLRSTLLHDGWEFAEEGWLDGRQPTYGFKPGWLPAEVPGHVHLDLVRNGVIADPFVKMQEWGCQWVDEKDWRYRTTFDWQPDESLPKRVLRFEGLDTVCTIWLNGEQVAAHDNMFLPLEIEVAERLKPGRNELEVRFESAQRVGRERREAYLKANHLPDDVANFDERAFVRKAQYMFGWDWGPRLVSCGIWKKVELIEYKARILDVWIQHKIEAGRVEVTVETQYEGEGVTPTHMLVDRVFLDGTATFAAWESGEEPAEPWLIPWIPVGSAPHPLDNGQNLRGGGYAFVTSLMLDSDPVIEMMKRKGPQPAGPWHARAEFEQDSRDSLFAPADVSLRRELDAFGESFEVVANGKPIWARGANWIPDNSFPSSITIDQLRTKLFDCAQGGFNMLRVWGGGLYESDDFYDICDQYGILVWQDFPHACSYYPDDEAAQAVVRAEAITNVKRLRNHPCLALWCGNNENQTMWEGAWGGKDKQPDREHGERLYHKVLAEVVSEYDPGRSYIPTSPIGTDPNHPELGCNVGGYGDSHFWDAWHGRGDWVHYSDSTARFSSEFGFASAPSMAAWEQAGIPRDTSLDAPELRWHDKTKKGWDTYIGFIKLHYPEPTSLDELIYYSQLNQRDAMRHAIEHYRRSEFCKGTLIWQLNDCWPVQSWSLIDSAGVPKAAFHELKRLYAPLLVSIKRDSDTASVHIINDDWDRHEGEATAVAMSLSTGEIVRDFGRAAVSLGSGERTKAFDLDLSGLAREDVVLIARFGDQVPPAWSLLSEPKEVASYDSGLSLRVETNGDLTLRGLLPVVDLRLDWVPQHEWLTVLATNWETRVPAARWKHEHDARCLGWAYGLDPAPA